MNYAKIMSTVILLGAMNIGAMGEATSPNGQLLAKVSKQHQVNIYDARTLALLKTIGNDVVSIQKFTSNNALLATVQSTAGIDPDHMCTKRATKTLFVNDQAEDSCLQQ